MMVRSMAPRIIVADEIGREEDIDAINYAMCSGCKGIFTAHGASFEDINLNSIFKALISKRIFERLIFLDENIKGQAKLVYGINKSNGKYETLKG